MLFYIYLKFFLLIQILIAIPAPKKDNQQPKPELNDYKLFYRDKAH